MVFYYENIYSETFSGDLSYDEGYQKLLEFYPEIRNMTSDARFDLLPLYNDFLAINVPSAEVYRNCICPLIVSDSSFPSTFFTEREHFSLYMLLYTVSGKGKLQYHDKTYILPPGSLFLINCNRHHYYYSDSPDKWRYFLIHFKGGNSDFLYDNAVRNGHCFYNMQHSKAYENMKKLKELFREPDENIDFELHMLLTGLLIWLANQKSRILNRAMTPEWAERAESYIVQNYYKNITLEELARLTNLSPSHFSHKFKEYSGVSPIEFQLSLRITRASELLQDTSMSIREIGETVGFNNQQNFITKFRSHFHCTPSEYRRTHSISPVD